MLSEWKKGAVMKTLLISRVMRHEGGATPIEYALITAMVAAIAVPALTIAGCSFDQILNAVSAVLSSTAG